MDFKYEPNRIYLQDADGALLAEVTFLTISNTAVEINHTFVDDSLRGQGVAAVLLKAAADHLRAEKKQVFPTCSYAVRWFEKNPAYADLLAAPRAQ